MSLLINVECSDFEVILNCSTSSILSTSIKMVCCEEYYAEVIHNLEPPQPLMAQYKCCATLIESGHGPLHTPGWEKSSYQAYIMGIAVFGIMICLFVSFARSIRRRRILARLHQRPQGALSANPSPQLNTQVSLGPPTYGELEASGLTKDYKMGDLSPPPYPGIVEDQEEYIHCVTPESYLNADSEENTETGETQNQEESASTENETDNSTRASTPRHNHNTQE